MESDAKNASLLTHFMSDVERYIPIEIDIKYFVDKKATQKNTLSQKDTDQYDFNLAKLRRLLHDFDSVQPPKDDNGLYSPEASIKSFRAEIDYLSKKVKLTNEQLDLDKSKSKAKRASKFAAARIAHIEKRVSDYERVILALGAPPLISDNWKHPISLPASTPACEFIPQTEALRVRVGRLTLTKSNFDRDNENFLLMLQESKFASSFFVFNDNQRKFDTQGIEAGAGNGQMRQFQHCHTPSFRTSGIPTGDERGYEELNDKTRVYIDKGIATVKHRIDRTYIDNVYYSVDTKGNFGSGTYYVSEDVKAYILHKLHVELGNPLPPPPSASPEVSEGEDEEEKEEDEEMEEQEAFTAQQQEQQQQEQQQQRHEEQESEDAEDEDEEVGGAGAGGEGGGDAGADAGAGAGGGEGGDAGDGVGGEGGGGAGAGAGGGAGGEGGGEGGGGEGGDAGDGDGDGDGGGGGGAAEGDGARVQYGYLVAFVLVCISVYVLLYEWTGEGNTGLLMGIMVVLTAAIGFVYMFILRRHIFPTSSLCAVEVPNIKPKVPLPKFARDGEEGDAFTNSNWYKAHTRTTPLRLTKDQQQPQRTS